MRGRTSIAAGAALLALSPAASAARPQAPANGCFALQSVQTGRFLVAGTSGYDAAARDRAHATAFFLKPSGLGTYLPYDRGGGFLSARGRAREAGPRTEWRLARAGGRLVLAGRRVGGRRGRFALVPARGCRPFPEARVGATGRPFEGTRPGGGVFGFADAHLHLTSDMRAGGRVLYGEAFDRFGIQRALGNDARDHGPDGGLDVTGNLLRTGLPFGTHDTHGWPTFAGWPVHDTVTHQQTYYVWLQRAFMAGLRLVVAQTVEDEPLCRLEPRRSHSCDETETIGLEVRRLRALQSYVDAQSGGPRKGWFRLVYSPRQARRAIKRGQMAVLIGVESSDLFGCSEYRGEPQCTRADVDRGIRLFKRWGIRSLFVAHWVNNAFAGAALEGGAQGIFINAMNALQTGRYFQTEPCPEPGQGEEVFFSLALVEAFQPAFPALAPLFGLGAAPVYPPGRQCNSKGLTDLGEYLIKRLIENHMLIEVDHLSEKARLQVLAIAEGEHYPLVSSHTETGGHWTPSDLRRLYALGGFAVARPDNSGPLAEAVLKLRDYRRRGRFFGVGLGTDTGGLGAQPGPEPDAGTEPLSYPFRSYDRKVKFGRQRTGERRFDLNGDGVAQYGLIPDLLARMQRRKDGKRAMRLLFRSAQAYIDTWNRAVRH
jgi:microsomal dipeptidase-like Zn-dependent dipeptidase